MMPDRLQVFGGDEAAEVHCYNSIEVLLDSVWVGKIPGTMLTRVCDGRALPAIHRGGNTRRFLTC